MGTPWSPRSPGRGAHGEELPGWEMQGPWEEFCGGAGKRLPRGVFWKYDYISILFALRKNKKQKQRPVCPVRVEAEGPVGTPEIGSGKGGGAQGTEGVSEVLPRPGWSLQCDHPRAVAYTHGHHGHHPNSAKPQLGQ